MRVYIRIVLMTVLESLALPHKNSGCLEHDIPIPKHS